MRARGYALAVASALLFAVGGCGGGAANDPSGASGGVRLYGTDGNMSNGLGDKLPNPGVLSGMTGTLPLTNLPDDFRHRLLAEDPKLGDFTYAGEIYDAVVITSLATEIARSTDPKTIAKYINGVTALAPGGVECDSVASCFDAIDEGKDIAYRGITVRSGFTERGEPSTTSYGTLHFGRDGHIDYGKTEYVPAGNADGAGKAAPQPTPQGRSSRGGPLKLGSLLPLTGALAFLSAPMVDSLKLAIHDVNAAGGVLGKPVEVISGDDGTNKDKTLASMDQLISAGVQVIIGPSTSGECVAAIPKAAAAGVVVFSPSATSDELSKIDDKGMFFRTSPPDMYQAQALSDIIMRAGSRKVYIVARHDSYGSGMQDNVVRDLVAAGIPKSSVKTQVYEDDQPNFDFVGREVKEFQPDAVLIIGYDESAKVIQAIVDAGVKLRH